MPDTAPTSKRYLKKAQVLARYGDRSATWIKRQQERLAFPEPAMHVGQSPLWLLSDLDAWDLVQAAKPAPKCARDMVAVRAARHNPAVQS
jgi:predicted DNA-binding transcriptional regulator AlpA